MIKIIKIIVVIPLLILCDIIGYIHGLAKDVGVEKHQEEN